MLDEPNNYRSEQIDRTKDRESEDNLNKKKNDIPKIGLGGMNKQTPGLGINKLNLAGIGRSDADNEETKVKVKDAPKKGVFNLDLSKAAKKEDVM